MKCCPFLFEVLEATEAFLLYVFEADVSEALPEFAGDYDASLGFAEGSFCFLEFVASAVKVHYD